MRPPSARRKAFSTKFCLPYHLNRNLNQQPISIGKSRGPARPPSEREGDHEVVEGACASKFFLIKYGYRAQIMDKTGRKLRLISTNQSRGPVKPSPVGEGGSRRLTDEVF